MLGLQRLRGEGPHEGKSLPDLVLLDLNMPRLDGRGVLEAMKSDPSLRRIPVVVLTGSDAETDIVASYDLGAACYVTRPVDLKSFEKIVSAIGSFWFAVVRFPDA